MCEALPPQTKRRLVFLNVLITCIATTMMSTALATALPPIIADLGISVATAQWLSSGYYLCMGIMVPLSAFLISRFPTRRLYLFVLGVFTVGLLACLLAPNFPIMMVGRLLQAAANGVLSPLGQVALMAIYPVDRRGAVMGWYGLSLGAAPVLAPTVTGILVDTVGWRSVFVPPLAIMLASILVAFLVFGDVIKTQRVPFRAISFFSCVIAFGGIAFGAGNIGTYPFFGPWVALPLAIGFTVGAYFAYRQLHVSQPFLELRTFTRKHFTMSVIGSMVLYITTMSSIVLLPLYVQGIEECSATVSGLITLPGSLAMAAISPIAGKIYDRVGIRPILALGAIFLLLSNFGMCLITVTSPVWIAAILNVFRQAAVGCLLMTFVTWGTESLPQNYVSHGTVILTSFRTIAGSAGMSLSVSIMTFVANALGGAASPLADLQGLQAAFFALGLTNLVLVAIAVLVLAEKPRP